MTRWKPFATGIAETDAQWKRRQQEIRHQTSFRWRRWRWCCSRRETGELWRWSAGEATAAASWITPVHAAAGIVVQAVRICGRIDERARSSVNGADPASTVIADEQTTFWYETTSPITPAISGTKFEGLMTLRYALAHSKNIPAVKVAEMVGYDKVAKVRARWG